MLSCESAWVYPPPCLLLRSSWLCGVYCSAAGLTSSCASASVIRHVFGLKANVKDNVHYADENVVMYPAGHNVVKYYAENKLQEFINGTDLSRGVTALAVSSDKR